MDTENKDCCDNCLEGEPCCDESILNEVTFEVPVTNKNFDSNELAKHLCCQNKYYLITKVLQTLDKKDAKQLRNELRSHTKLNQLPLHLETKFREHLKEK